MNQDFNALKHHFDKLTPSQKKAVFHVEGPLLVLAGPGSGKTRVITNRIAALILSGVSPHNICAITFTNKAAEEMRQRVIDMNTPSGSHISTFHSLCVRLLRTYGTYAGIKSNFSINHDVNEIISFVNNISSLSPFSIQILIKKPTSTSYLLQICCISISLPSNKFINFPI
jgi:superfamily I DNA/RNA helicase